MWPSIPALPPETAVLATESPAIPLDETATAPTPEPIGADSDTETAVNWLPYIILLMILLGIGAWLTYASRQQ